MDDNNSTMHKIYYAIRNMSIIKTVYFSIICRGLIIVGKGSRVNLERGAHVVVPKGSLLAIGLHYELPFGAALNVKKGGTLHIDGRVHFARGASVMVGPGAMLSIGAGTFINENSKIICKKKITLGEHCGIGWNNNIIDSDMHSIVQDGSRKNFDSPIKIGNHVWTGLGVTILKGVTIGNGAIVAAGSLIVKDVPERSLSGGNPGRTIKTDISWTD